MNNFGEVYSQYYDLLYQDKDYSAETQYIKDLIGEKKSTIKSILELGCGTGKHAELLAKSGIDMCCVDLSSEMLESAEKRCSYLKDRITFHQGDISEFTINREFDAVISLFHVMSYQNDNASVIKTIKNAAKHLKTGGVFVFDFWYGPGVLTDRPQNRIKRVSNDDIEVIRFAEPVIKLERNVVEVNYHVYIKDKKLNRLVEKKEQHNMRYFFLPEMTYYLEQCGFIISDAYQWMTFQPVVSDVWNIVVVAEKK